MSTFISFHIETNDINGVATSLQRLSGIKNIIKGDWPADLLQSTLMGEDVDPTYMVIYLNTNGWTSVCCNSFKKLQEWAEQLSREFNSLFIQTLGQNTSDVYYFLMYDNGIKRREIYVYYGEDEAIVDYGDKFPFEKPIIHNTVDDIDQSVFFDWDSIEHYCTQLGIESTEDDHNEFLIIKADHLGKTFHQHVEERNQAVKKPWWKLW